MKELKYYSTRDLRLTDAFTGPQAILQGLADDGGLFVPDRFPQLDLSRLKGLAYPDLASEILSLYLPFSRQDLSAACRVYAERFGPTVVPLVGLDHCYLMELFHGPTLAFKDFALQLLPRLIQLSLKAQARSENILILTATSGDTGKAALAGFAGVDQTGVVVFYPDQGVSRIQALQMLTQEGGNLQVYPIKGNFDDAQAGVKQILGDPQLATVLAGHQIKMSSANSINIGRLLPQIVYYVYSYLQLDLPEGQAIDVCVPCGNFGNILAAVYAKKMGLPLANFIVASNSNDVLTDFFTSGHYDSKRALKLTHSPSMDILISSNLERFLYDLDPEAGAKAMSDLQTKGSFSWPTELPQNFYAYRADDREAAEAIQKVYRGYNYVLDPHTAVAYAAYCQYRAQEGDRPCLLASTASPFKFPGPVLQALDQPLPADIFSQLGALSELADIPVPRPLAQLKHLPVRFDETLTTEAMKDGVKRAARQLFNY